jgi:hypothetical protein
MNQEPAIIAIANIAKSHLRIVCDHRITHDMNTPANLVIDHLGGTSAVARMIEAPTSTVHSWRRIGIPPSRMAHLRLAAMAAGRDLPEDLGVLAHADADAAAQHDASPGKSNGISPGESVYV